MKTTATNVVRLESRLGNLTLYCISDHIWSLPIVVSLFVSSFQLAIKKNLLQSDHIWSLYYGIPICELLWVLCKGFIIPELKTWYSLLSYWKTPVSLFFTINICFKKMLATSCLVIVISIILFYYFDKLFHREYTHTVKIRWRNNNNV